MKKHLQRLGALFRGKSAGVAFAAILLSAFVLTAKDSTPNPWMALTGASQSQIQAYTAPDVGTYQAKDATAMMETLVIRIDKYYGANWTTSAAGTTIAKTNGGGGHYGLTLARCSGMEPLYQQAYLRSAPKVHTFTPLYVKFGGASTTLPYSLASEFINTRTLNTVMHC